MKKRWLRARLVGEAVADDAPEGLEAVFPGDLFPFFVSTAGVGDGHFVDAPIPFCDFGGDFRFEAEAMGLEVSLRLVKMSESSVSNLLAT